MAAIITVVWHLVDGVAGTVAMLLGAVLVALVSGQIYLAVRRLRVRR
jgi:hypothetical protein